MSPADAPPPNVSDWLTTASRLFRATLLKCLPLAMLAVLASMVGQIYWLAKGHAPSLTVPDDPVFLGLSFAGLIVELLLVLAMLLRQRLLAGGSMVDVRTEVSAAFLRVPMALLSVLIVGLGITFLTALLATVSLNVALAVMAVPVIFMLVCCSVLLPVLLFERISPFGALVRSVKLIMPRWWHVFAAMVIAFLVILVCAFAFGAALSVLVALLPQDSPVAIAVRTAALIGFLGAVYVFVSALSLVLYSAANSSV